MKQRTFIFSLLLSFCLCASGQQPESLYSHVSERIYLDGNGTSHIDNVTYLDGFGRKSQETGISGTPDGTGDLILPYRYGQGGRTEFEYLPYPKTGNGGAYDPTYLLPANWNAYGGQDAGYAYSLTEYECSPLDRITRRTGPGAAWHTSGKSVSYSYAMNATGEVPLYRISLSGMPVAGGHYGAGSLRKVTATDEDGRTTETFTDNAGRTVLTVAADGSGRFLTCRVYDDHGRLRWVLPPEAVRLLSTGASSSQLHGTAWYYEYDRLGRQTFHRAPGCDPVYTVYDNNDRPVLVQDGNLRARNAALWEYRRYDGAGRLTESGELLLTSASTHASLQALLLQGGELPQGTCTPLQYTVYDSYTSVAGFSPHAFQAVSGYSGDYHREVVGLTAYTCSRVLGTDEWTVTAYYYDEQCRVIQTVSNMLRGGLYRTDTAYDFTGRMLKCREAYDGRTMENTYVYDSRSRLLNVSASLNGNAPVSLIRNEYDGVGRLKSVTHNGKANLKTEYSYNIRSWVTNMSNPLYSQTLTYGYGGNIATQQWVQDSKTRKYTYTYDGLNRLTHAAYTGDGNYTANYSYDNMGNITSLKRYDVSLVDNLTYTYNGNQLTKVEDATSNAFGFANGASTTNEYTYDANGNLTKDSNKGIASITYNSLNLPQVVTFSNGNTITYLYNADGRKLRTIHVTNGTATTTDYCGNVIYENGTARLLLTETGYVDLTDNSHHFYIKDHLGNNRVVADANGTVEESNQYYPFGLNYADAGSNLQPYKYNGKELDTKNGLNWYDYGARHYDAALGRFMTQDRFAEKYTSLSPYQYGANSPVCNVDVNGDSISIAKIVSLDKAIGSDIISKIINDLQSQTGLNLSVKDGMLMYAKDEKGNPIVGEGSATARRLLIQSINHSDVVNVEIAGRSGVVSGTNELRLGIKQINKFVEGSVGVNSRTLGFGMTFLHELHHTKVGGGLKDTPGILGPVVERMNIIRSELNALDGNYGIRMDYRATMINGEVFIPFNAEAQRRIYSGWLPNSKSKYVKF